MRVGLIDSPMVESSSTIGMNTMVGLSIDVLKIRSVSDYSVQRNGILSAGRPQDKQILSAGRPHLRYVTIRYVILPQPPRARGFATN